MIDYVVFIPGICGSELYDGEECIWPGTAIQAEGITSYPDDFVVKLATDKSLTVRNILDKVSLVGWGFDHFATGYDKALSLLGDLGFNDKNHNILRYPYDWRKDIRSVAKEFCDKLRSDSRLSGKHIAIVSHSMGGLIARYALEILGGLSNVKLLVLCAVPNHGAPATYQRLIGEKSEIFLSKAQCKIVAQSQEFPAAYQLLPRPGCQSFFETGRDGPWNVDIYDPAVYSSRGLLQKSMDIAKETWGELSLLHLEGKNPCPYFAIAGSSGSTNIANYLLPAHPTATINTEVSGDGTVPLWSSAPAALPCRFVPTDHLGVFEDSQTEVILRGLLLPSTEPGPVVFSGSAPPSFQGLPLSLSDNSSRVSIQPYRRSIETGEAVLISILLRDGTQSSLDGTISVQTYVNESKSTFHSIQAVKYEGAPIRKIDVVVQSRDSGVMVIDFATAGSPSQSARATILVLPKDLS